MRLRYAIPALIVLAAGRVLADEANAFNPTDYPRDVQQAPHYANEECTSQGGGAVSFAPDSVRKFDLTGVGRDD